MFEPLNAQDYVGTADGKDVKIHGERRALKEEGSLVADMGARDDGAFLERGVEDEV